MVGPGLRHDADHELEGKEDGEHHVPVLHGRELHWRRVVRDVLFEGITLSRRSFRAITLSCRGFRVQGLGFGDWGFGFRVSGFGLGV